MKTQIDLSQLAIKRHDDGPASARPRAQARQWATRYVLPAGLVVGYVFLMLWASWSFFFPPKLVTVIPVISTRSTAAQQGAPLFKAAGWIEPRPTPIRVAALAPGVVKKLLVVEDQPVEQGQPVAEFVKDDAQLDYQMALANLKLREAERDQADSQLQAAQVRHKQPVHLELALRQAQAAQAKIDTELANLPFQRQRAQADLNANQKTYEAKLASKGIVSGVSIEIAKNRFQSSQFLVKELEKRAESLKAERTALLARCTACQTQLELLADEVNAVNTARSQVKAATARIEQAKVEVQQAKLRLDRMTIRAPVAGRVYSVIGHPGARIGSGLLHASNHDGSTVVTLYQPSMLQLRVDVRFEDLPKIALHQPVEINNPALTTPLVGNVLYIGSQADIQKNTLQVKVSIPNPPKVFKPEMLVDATFLAPKPTGPSQEQEQPLRLYIPAQLLQETEAGSFVWTANQSLGQAERKKVSIGKKQANDLIEIKSGLSATSRLIVQGVENLTPGQRIAIKTDSTTTINSPNQNASTQSPTNP